MTHQAVVKFQREFEDQVRVCVAPPVSSAVAGELGPAPASPPLSHCHLPLARWPVIRAALPVCARPSQLNLRTWPPSSQTWGQSSAFIVIVCSHPPSPRMTQLLKAATNIHRLQVIARLQLHATMAIPTVFGLQLRACGRLAVHPR